MAEPRRDIKEKMKLLRESYLRQLPERIEEMDACCGGLKKDPGDREIAKNLHRLAHSIKGSSASFGFGEVSAAALSLDKLLKPFVETGTQLAEGLLPDILGIIDRLKSAVELMNQRHLEEAAAIVSDQIRQEIAERAERRLVFIAEGDPSLLKELSEQIHQFGYDVAVFSRFDELSDAIGEKSPSAVVLDFELPEGVRSEPATVITIRNRLGNGIPAIFISERDDITARLQAVKAGSDAYFVKPVNITDLMDKLDSLTTSRVSEPYKILIVDDEPELAAYHALILQEAGMATEIVNEPLQVFERLFEFGPDLILMDMYMPECDGMELAKTIRQMGAYFSIPIVFLSGETNIDKQLSAMRMGGDEFLTKPIKPDHLISSVAIRAERMRTIRSFMERDSLTGLLNHTRTKLQLDIAVTRARRLGAHMAFAMIDIDRFKTVNDTYGHPTGDRVITGLSRLLQQRLRKTDIIGRYGGEEFAVVLNETNAHYAKKMLDELRTIFSQIKFRHQDKEFSVTFSAGVAVYPEFEDAETIGDAADKALYEAKRSGRNRVIIAPG
ncbi:MAG: diguanylate cyclase [Nitrospirota bacterium]